MEASQIFRTLWLHKRALALVFAVAVLAAVASSYRITRSGLERRATPTGAATAQILVDSPQSALGNLKQNTVPLSTRAGVYAQFMASSAVRDEIAAVTRIPSSEIVAQGPFDDPAAAPTGDTAPTPPDTASLMRGKPYRLTFVSQADLPLVTVYAQAPTVGGAARLANGAAEGVRRYVDAVQSQGNLDSAHRVVIRSLGPAEAGKVGAGATLPMMLLAFLAVMTVGTLSILFLVAIRRRRQARDHAQAEAQAEIEWLPDEPAVTDMDMGPGSEVEDDDWPPYEDAGTFRARPRESDRAAG